MIKLKNITKKYNEKLLFDKLNLNLETDKKYVIIGKTGSGKSTLFNIIAGIDLDFTGDIEILEYKNPNFFKNKYFRNDICLILQSDLLELNKSVADNLSILGNRSDILKALSKVELDSFIDELVINLSGGQRSRINLCRMFLKKSAIYLIDEPTSNLDLDNKILITKLILQVEGTVLVITHDLQCLDLYDQTINLDIENNL